MEASNGFAAAVAQDVGLGERLFANVAGGPVPLTHVGIGSAVFGYRIGSSDVFNYPAIFQLGGLVS